MPGKVLRRDAYGTGQAGLNLEGPWLARIINQEVGAPLGPTWWSQIKRELRGFLEIEENHEGDRLAMTVRTDFKLSIHELESAFRNCVPSDK